MTMRRRILLLTIGIAGLVLIIFAIPLALLLRSSAESAALDKGTDLAHSVADYASTSANRVYLKAFVKRINDRESAPSVGVDLPDGSHIGATSPRGSKPPDGDDASRVPHDGDDRFAQTTPAQTADVPGGHVVMIRVAGTGGMTTVSVFVSSAEVRHTVNERLLVLGAAAVGALVVAGIAAELVSRRLVRGLGAAAATADRLSEGDLEARTPEHGPAEVRRVAVALNRLAERIDELLLLERETVADLSHRLRTPLTAVRLDVEALPDSPERTELEGHLDLLERTLTAVIRTARRPEREGPIPHCDASAVVSERVDFWSPLLEEQGRDITRELAEQGLTARCAAADLAAAVDALIENVVAHTPDGTAATVSLHAIDRRLTLEVRDRGPGIPHGAVGRGRSDRGSSGLGLDIARSCAEASGGRLEIEERGGWNVVRLLLGRP